FHDAAFARVVPRARRCGRVLCRSGVRRSLAGGPRTRRERPTGDRRIPEGPARGTHRAELPRRTDQLDLDLRRSGPAPAVWAASQAAAGPMSLRALSSLYE